MSDDSLIEPVGLMKVVRLDEELFRLSLQLGDEDYVWTLTMDELFNTIDRLLMEFTPRQLIGQNYML